MPRAQDAEMTDVKTPMGCGLQTRCLRKGLCSYCRPATIQAHSKELVVKRLLEAQSHRHDKVEAILPGPDFCDGTSHLCSRGRGRRGMKITSHHASSELVELLAACMGKRGDTVQPRCVQDTGSDKAQIFWEAPDHSHRHHSEVREPDTVTVEYLFYSDFRKSELETELVMLM